MMCNTFFRFTFWLCHNFKLKIFVYLGLLNLTDRLIACQSLASCPGLANGSFRIKVILRSKRLRQATDWLWQATDLASKGYFVYIHSCRGYGSSIHGQIQCNPDSYCTQGIDIF